jgi:hypothetical protein
MSVRRQWGLLILVVFLVQLWGHVVVHRPGGLILDDWTNLRSAQAFDSPSALLAQTLSHGTRPASVSTTWLAFRLLGIHLNVYFALSVAAQLLLLLLVMSIARQLGASLAATFLAGLFVAVLPTLSELYFWPTMILSTTSFALPLYLGSAAAWLAYSRNRKPIWLILSLATYALGVFSYEIGLFLPLVFVCAPRQGSFRKQMAKGLAFAPVLLLYAAWRLTNAFGLGHTSLPSHMQGGISLLGLLVNVKEFVQWWIGWQMGASVLNGWHGFTSLSAGTQGILFAGNLALAGLAGWTLLALTKETTTPRNKRSHLAAWGAFWLVASFLPLAISYSTSRLMYLPACGLAWLLAPLFLPRFRWALAVPLTLATAALLTVNQGTARQWQDSGHLQQRLFDHVRATRSEWQDKEIVLFDTQALTVPGSGEKALHPSPFGLPFYYGNAGFLRGFAPSAMLDLAGREGTWPLSLLDGEHWPVIREGQLIWHRRYDPTIINITPMNQVFRIDVATVTAP